MTTDCQGLVESFHSRMKYRYPTPALPDYDRDLILKRTSYLAEEFREYRDAVAQCNRVEILDALVDMQYILSGTILATGVWSLYSNEFQPPSADEVEIPHYVNRIAGAISDMSTVLTLSPDDLSAICHCVQDGIRELTHAHGFTSVFDAAFLVVHEANMCKVWSRAQVSAYGAMPHVGEPYRFEETDGGWIATDSTNKVKKPFNFVKPDLTKFI